ncbi:Protein LlR18B, variant 4 [Stylosanthes scabra]|uniref:Protein LlR18B, variant 2 n=1 Tax=Stylosanthes scabra TaxID=79078 RepID=A0ABU6TIF3_9FABA|nr:Protein LlR18B, variant 2 [Stylosanthes scabra]MED6148147.1 Protein LlR18B, variant 4 [Stylosanthes scabra]
MGVHSFEEEAASPVPPAKLFKATVHDSDDITPKVIPVIQSIEIVEGNGGPGTVKKITAVEDGKSSYVLNKVDAIDEGSYTYEYSIIGGTGFQESLEKVSFKTKFEAADGGSKVKITVTFYTKGDAPLTEEIQQDIKQKSVGIFKGIEGYILANS